MTNRADPPILKFSLYSIINCTNSIDISDALRRVKSGELDMEKICLKCLKLPKNKTEQHPFFVGSLCKECSV